MKPFIIPFVVALVAGIGIASGAAIMREKGKPAPVVSDSTAKHDADTTAVRVIEPGSVSEPPAGGAAPARTESALADSARKVVTPVAGKPDTARTTAQPSVATAHPANQPASPTTAALKPAPAAEAPVAEKRIARVIAAMAPKDAAKVLAQMSDHDVAIIIGNLTEKQEAAILSAMPADRLAAVTKLAFRPTPGTK